MINEHAFKEGFEAYTTGDENEYDQTSEPYVQWREGYGWADRIARLCRRAIEQKEAAELEAALEDKSLHITMWPPLGFDGVGASGDTNGH